jgi:hypothetical protein
MQRFSGRVWTMTSAAAGSMRCVRRRCHPASFATGRCARPRHWRKAAEADAIAKSPVRRHRRYVNRADETFFTFSATDTEMRRIV